MPLVMQVVEGRCCPVVVCDHCQGEIEDALNGNYQWRSEQAERSYARVYFTHKECCPSFEQARPESSWHAEELELLPLLLGRNLSLDWKEARALAKRRGAFQPSEPGL
jgi:hypothetical protein